MQSPATEGPARDDAAAPENERKGDDEVNGTVWTHTWVISQWSRRCREERFNSEEFVIADRKWRLLCIPDFGRSAHTAFFLEYRDDWHKPRRFRFRMSLPRVPALEKTNNDFEFNERGASDQGFTNFLPHKDWRAAIDEKDTITFKVSIEPITGFSAPEMEDAKELGFYGIRNQGATCYMNSMLQSLFNLPNFRKAVYQMHTEGEFKNQSPKGIALALQRLFFGLQYARDSASTKQLTQSFGWDSIDAFMQHDVQEFCRVLVDSLEETMKGTDVNGAMARLFEGKSQTYIECYDVDYKSERTETFWDLAMQVKGQPNLLASFSQYIEVEELKGENRYRTDKYGLQDAKKGVRILKFPKVLQLQLKRFDFDPIAGQMQKVNDKFEFPSVLDLDGHLAKSVQRDPADPEVYYLHSVLVHSGSVHGGHYYVYVRPIPPQGEYTKAQWFKFDDEHVYKVSEETAIDKSFGGDEVLKTHFWGQERSEKYKRVANAYMLIYMRKSEVEHLQRSALEEQQRRRELGITSPTAQMAAAKEGEGQQAIQRIHVEAPHHLIERFRKEEEARRKAVEEAKIAHLYTKIKLTSEADLFATPDLRFEFYHDVRDKKRGITSVAPTVRELKVEKAMSVSQWVPEAEKITGVPAERQMYFVVSTRTNDTLRPNNWLTDPGKSFASLGGSQGHMVHLWLRDTDYDQAGPKDSNQLTPENSMNKEGDRSLILLKYFDVETQRLHFAGSLIFYKTLTMKEAVEYVKGLLVKRNLLSPEVFKEEQEPLPAAAQPADAIWASVGLRAWEEENAFSGKLPYQQKPEEELLKLMFRHGDMLLVQRSLGPKQLEKMRAAHTARYQAYLQRKEQRDASAREQGTKSEGETKAGDGNHAGETKGEGVNPEQKRADTASRKEQDDEPVVYPNFFETVQEYVMYHMNRVYVNLRKTGRQTKDSADTFVELSRMDTYDTFATKIAKVLGEDAMKLRFYKSKSYQDAPESYALDRNQDPLAKVLGLPPKEPNALPTLFYEVSRYSWDDLERNRVISLNFLHWTLVETPLEFLVPRDGTVADLNALIKKRMEQDLTKEDALVAEHLNELKEGAKLPPSDGPRQWRKLRYIVFDHQKRPKTIFSDEKIAIKDIPDPQAYHQTAPPLCVEEVTPEELEMGSGDKQIRCATFYQQSVRQDYKPPSQLPVLTGPAFPFVLKAGEPFSQTKLRLQRRLGSDDETFARLRFYELQPGEARHEWQDDRVLADLAWEKFPGCYLGILDPDHKPKTTHVASYGSSWYSNKGIKIKSAAT